MKKDSTKNQTFNELAKQIRLRGPDWFRNPKIKDFDRALEKAGVNRIGAKDLTLRCMKCGKIWLPEFEKGQPMQEFWKCPSCNTERLQNHKSDIFGSRIAREKKETDMSQRGQENHNQ